MKSYILFNKLFCDPIDAAFQMICWLKENKKL